MLSLYHQFVFAARLAFRTIIPEPHDRTPYSWHAFPYFITAASSYLFLAYLARRPDTYLVRLLILPLVIQSVFYCAYNFVWTTPQLNVYNFGQCLLALTLVSKSLDFALSPEGTKKYHESTPGAIATSGTLQAKSVNSRLHINGYTANGNGTPKLNETVADSPREISFWPKWLADTLEVAMTLRGLKFEWSHGMYVPPPTRPQERGPFLKATLISLVLNFLQLDLLESLLKLFPGVGSIYGGSMFYQNLPMTQRYAVSTLIHLLTGTCILAGFGMIYDLLTLIAVGIVGNQPASWPPVLDNPWTSDSLQSLWAKRWHQILRRTFIVYGGYPGKWIGGRLGGIIGTFIASGLFHEVAIYAMGRGWDWRPLCFFTSQAFLVIGEYLFKKVTGKKVQGWPGRIWVYLVIFGLGQVTTDSWHTRGLGGGMVIPPVISPTRWALHFVYPLLSSSSKSGQ